MKIWIQISVFKFRNRIKSAIHSRNRKRKIVTDIHEHRRKKFWSGNFSRHSLKSGPETQDPETLRPGTLGVGTLGLWDPGTLDPDTQDPGNKSLGIGNCYSETQNPESMTLRIELVTQIPSILTHTADWINFNCEANFDNKKLGHLSQKLDACAGVDRPKHLPKYFVIWHNSKKLENI